MWFRNETTLLVLWQPPYPAGTYSHYKVSIDPPDALDSVLYVEKEGEPPGPAQAAFKGLIPGNFDITQTDLFENMIVFNFHSIFKVELTIYQFKQCRKKKYRHRPQHNIERFL